MAASKWYSVSGTISWFTNTYSTGDTWSGDYEASEQIHAPNAKAAEQGVLERLMVVNGWVDARWKSATVVIAQPQTVAGNEE